MWKAGTISADHLIRKHPDAKPRLFDEATAGAIQTV